MLIALAGPRRTPDFGRLFKCVIYLCLHLSKTIHIHDRKARFIVCRFSF
jgi:hypothetical protein